MASKTRIRLHSLRRWLAGASLPLYGYDGIAPDAAAIAKAFPDASFVAGYDTGGWPWTSQDWALFPHAKRVQIVTSASQNEGQVLDVETGDAAPAQAEAWITKRKAAGLYKPTIYCNRSNLPAVRNGTGKWILGRDYDIWCADWTGKPHQVISDGTPCVATQYGNADDWDLDVAYSAAWPEVKAPVVADDVPLKRYVSTGTVSLLAAASGYKVDALLIAMCSIEHEYPKNIENFVKYLSAGNGPSEVMPRGLVYWVPAHTS